MKLYTSILILLSVALIQFIHEPYNTLIEKSADAPSNVKHFLKNIPSLPRYMERGYSPLGRSPVVDTLLADPLYMPKYTETVTQLIKNHSTVKLLFPLLTALQIAGGIPTKKINVNEVLKSADKIPEEFLSSFSSPMAAKVYSYYVAFREIHQEVEEYLSVLSKEEKAWIRTNCDRFFFGNDPLGPEYDFFSTDSPYPLEFFKLASRLNIAGLVDSARKLSLIADDFYLSHKDFEAVLLNDDFVWRADNLTMIISQRNHVQHNDEVDFFIDLGGHNTFHTNAGGTKGERALSLHIDLKGYNTFKGTNFVQGCGFLGVGLLVSYAGDNHFFADKYAQGCGFFGAGNLVNFGGNNRYQLNFGGQSFALFGSSVLWDKEGGNEYVASEGMAQAASSTLGVAYLIDNQGHNSFTCGVSGKGGLRDGGIGQGGSTGIRGEPWLNNPSFYGGLSFLYIGDGSNKLKTAWLGQGSAYLLGAGIFVVDGSNNIVEADYDAQGQGLHLAAGLLSYKGQHSLFKGGWGSLGVSGDRSVGMFIGIGNNNDYVGTDQSVGTSRKPYSLGLFMAMGDNNNYKFQKLSNANLQYPQSPKEWSSALFLHVGTDVHYPSNVDEFSRGNGMQWGVEKHSLGLSVESIGDDPVKDLMSEFHNVANISFPFDPVQGWSTNTSYLPINTDLGQIYELAQELPKANYDRRRQIYETLELIRFSDRKMEYDLSNVLKNPAAVNEDVFNFAVLWALRNKEKIDLSEICEALITETLASDYARQMGVSLVGTLWKPTVISILTRIMQKDRSEEVRYYAALALAKNLKDDHQNILREGLKSDSEVVRYAIVKGLQESSNPDALEIVVPMFTDSSFYVRRAAGMTAVSLGDKRGVSVLLETLQFDTPDTGDNYGDNLYKQLTKYLSVDFKLDKQAWINWWKKAEHDFQFRKTACLQSNGFY